MPTYTITSLVEAETVFYGPESWDRSAGGGNSVRYVGICLLEMSPEAIKAEGVIIKFSTQEIESYYQRLHTIRGNGGLSIEFGPKRRITSFRTSASLDAGSTPEVLLLEAYLKEPTAFTLDYPVSTDDLYIEVINNKNLEEYIVSSSESAISSVLFSALRAEYAAIFRLLSLSQLIQKFMKKI